MPAVTVAMTKLVKPKTNQAIARSLEVLEILSRQQDHIGVRELAALVRISPATAERILATLNVCGYVKKSVDGRYAITTKILQVAENLLERMELPRIATPVLRDVRDRCDETVSLFVVEGTQRVCITCEHSRQGIRRVVPIGSSLPLYAGASGKLLLAFLPDNAREKILSRASFQRFTDQTVTDAKALRLEMDCIREKSYAVSLGERVSGAASVATPVRDAKGTVVAAFTISAPRDRFEAAASSLVELALEGSARISEQMGYRSSTPNAPRMR